MSIELNINSKLAKKVAEVSEQLHIDSNELIIKAIKKFLHNQEITLIRKQLKDVAKKNGFNSEEDVYNAIS
jgi:hypothetical protein